MNTTMCIETPAKYFYLPTVLVVAILIGFGMQHRCYSRIKMFRGALESDERVLYEQIVRERKRLTMTSIFLGIICVIVYIVCNCLYGWRNRKMYYIVSDILCIFVASVYVFYLMAPKKKYMLSDARLSSDEVRKWFQVYVCMEQSFWKAFLIGLIASMWVLLMMDLFLPYRMTCVSYVVLPRRTVQQKTCGGRRAIRK